MTAPEPVNVLERIQSLEADLRKQQIRIEMLEEERNQFLVLLRRAKLQNVRAKEKLTDWVKSDAQHDEPELGIMFSQMLDTFLSEGRRSDLQIVSYASKQTGMKDRKSKRKSNKINNRHD